jgi:hypothetical protein
VAWLPQLPGPNHPGVTARRADASLVTGRTPLGRATTAQCQQSAVVLAPQRGLLPDQVRKAGEGAGNVLAGLVIDELSVLDLPVGPGDQEPPAAEGPGRRYR